MSSETDYSYQVMSVIEALQNAKNGFMLLPDIQREYCWSIMDIESLFDSILDDYPIGSFIFWKVNKKIINDQKPNLYQFIKEYSYKDSENEPAPSPITEEGDYYIVLDGQQRLTSLNIALYGTYGIKRKYKWNKNDDSWFKSELYYNLDHYNIEHFSVDEQDEKQANRFVFLDSDNMPGSNYYKVKNIVGYNSVADLVTDLNKLNINSKSRDDLVKLYNKLFDKSDKSIVHYYCINNESYNNALNVFVKVNSTGVKLSKTDLLFSTLISGWKTRKDPKKEIDKLIKDQNRKGDRFNFTRDYLMRLCLVLVDANTTFDIKSLDSNTIEKIKNNWVQISKTFKKLTDVLVNIGLSDKTITSYNATMPVAYYLHNGGKTDAISLKEIRKFLAISMSKNLFGIASNDALVKARNAIKEIDRKDNSFSMDLFKNTVLTGDRRFSVTKDEIDNWINRYEKGSNTFLLLTLLYPNLKYGSVQFHQDHCHPYALFRRKNLRKLKISQEKIIEWQRLRNTIPNLQLLEEKDNVSKNKTPLKEWIEKGNELKYLPKKVSLELKDFDEFYSKRSELIKKELLNIFEIQ